MIMHKQKQGIGVLEQATLPSLQDDVEHSQCVLLAPFSPNYDEQTRLTRIETIKAQLTEKRYHINPRSLAQAIYNYSTKRHQ
jgi:anti-sigma28 factor (negative regulator of flagellin synthesis)